MEKYLAPARCILQAPRGGKGGELWGFGTVGTRGPREFEVLDTSKHQERHREVSACLIHSESVPIPMNPVNWGNRQWQLPVKYQWEDLLLTPDYWIPTCDLFQKPVWQPDRLTGNARFRGSVPVGSCAGLRARAGLDNRLRTRQATDIDRLGNPGI